MLPSDGLERLCGTATHKRLNNGRFVLLTARDKGAELWYPSHIHDEMAGNA